MSDATLPEELPDGKLRVPVAVSSEGAVGEGSAVIGPDDPRYGAWKQWIDLKKAKKKGK